MTPPARRSRLLPPVGGLATLAVVYLAARSDGRTEVVTLVLTGIAVNALTGAVIGLLTYVSTDEELRSITFWTLGSVAQATWPKVFAVAPVAVVGVVLATASARRLDLLALGEQPARHLGVDVERLRVPMLVVVALLTASAVAVSGVILFVGLTAYDTQWIKRQAEVLEIQGVNSGAAAVRQVAIIGALKLYLDFVNLFLYILRIVNNR